MATVSILNLLTGSSSPLLASGDVVPFVDIDDSTQSPSGSTVKATLTQFFAAIPVPIVVTSASANALAVGRLGATTPAFTVDASTASQVAGLKVTGAATGGTVAVVVTDSGSNANLTVNAKGSGTIGIGSVSTGAVTITPATTITGALTQTGLATFNGGATIASGQTLTITGVTITGLTAASVGAGTFPAGAFLFQGTVTTAGSVLLDVNTASTTTMMIDNAGAGQVEWRLLRTGGTATDWIGYAPAGSSDFRLYNNGDQFTFTAAGALTTASTLTVTAGGLTVSSGTSALQSVTATGLTVTAASTSKLLIQTAAAAEIGVRILRTVNTATDWEIFAAVGETQLTFYNGAARATLTTAGALALAAGITATTGTFSGALSGITTLAASGTVTLSATGTSLSASGDIVLPDGKAVTFDGLGGATSDYKIFKDGSNGLSLKAGSTVITMLPAPSNEIALGGALRIGSASLTSQPLWALLITDTDAPSNTPSGGGVLWVESGALKFKGSSGTVTDIAPA